MRLFSQMSKLCLLTLLLLLVYGGDGQGDKSIFERNFQETQAGKIYIDYAGQCGSRPIEGPGLMYPERLRRSAASFDDSVSATDDLNVASYSQGRVIGGRNAIPGEFPWQASLQRIYVEDDGSKTSSHACGAVIINEYWLLTAAHCFYVSLNEDFNISVGENNLEVHDNGEQIFVAEKKIQHEKFNIWTLDNDIALIKIKPINGRGIQFNRNVQPACLPDRKTQFKVGKRCLLSGWGLTEANGKGSNILQAAALSIVDTRKCKELHVNRNTISKNTICAGDPAGRMGGCGGDSGGPLVCKVGNKYTVCGVVSWGGLGCRPDYPTVFARVTEYLSWIADIISQNV